MTVIYVNKCIDKISVKFNAVSTFYLTTKINIITIRLLYLEFICHDSMYPDGT